MPIPRYVVAILFVAVIIFVVEKLFHKEKEYEVHLATPDQVEVIHTNGGLLQVSTIKAVESFQATKDHHILGLIPMGETVTLIRVPAVFHYHIELAPEWKVLVIGKTLIVVAPIVRPTLPIAIDTSRLQRFSSGTWSVFTGRTELDLLQRSITQTLAVKAYTSSYLQYQRETARKTVVQFVEKWLITQERFKVGGPYAVRVYFADERIEAIHSF